MEAKFNTIFIFGSKRSRKNCDEVTGVRGGH